MVGKRFGLVHPRRVASFATTRSHFFALLGIMRLFGVGYASHTALQTNSQPAATAAVCPNDMGRFKNISWPSCGIIEITSDSNRSERELHPIATYRKVAGGVRSGWGMGMFAAVRSTIGTATRAYRSLSGHSRYLIGIKHVGTKLSSYKSRSY